MAAIKIELELKRPRTLALSSCECYYTLTPKSLSSRAATFIMRIMRKWSSKPRSGSPPPVSIVIATYKKPRELELVLAGYLRQTVLRKDPAGFELIIADDGSGPEIEALTRSFAAQASFPVTYLWQEDRGWGKPRMLNWATLEAQAGRIVYTDADCIPHRHFVHAHIQEAREDSVACGRRVDLFEKVSQSITLQSVQAGTLENPGFLLDKAINGEIDFGQQGLYLPYMVARALTALYRKPRLLGSNMGVHKSKVVDINGFDESFAVPGVGEDTDMQRRFELAGLKIRWITYRAVQYHLWHSLTPVGAQAHKIFEDLKGQGQARAVRGIAEFKLSTPPSSIPAKP
jgi:cellulose synthase/poly-beta-1,6-N-acetylglucosamine synthase-like glycosyltransferase